MPNIPQQETIVQYVANSAQTQYTFAFYAPLPTDIQVFYQASTATPVPSADILAINTDYTVTYNADPITGGYITLLFTPTTGYYLTINRQVAASLNVNFALAQNFNGANLDAALDRLLLLCQQNQNYALERNLSYIINTYLPNAVPYTQLPPLPQNSVWIGSGAGVIAAQISTVPSASVLQSMLANNSPGTDGARIVGYYDVTNAFPTTVDTFLGYKVTSAADTSAIIDSITVALSASYTLFDGNILVVKVANGNDGATTLTINGGAALNVVKYNQSGGFAPLTGFELSTNGVYLFLYVAGSSSWLLVNPNTIATNYFYGASVFLTGTQLVGIGSTVAALDTVGYDNFSMFVPASNYLLPSRPGYYTATGIVLIIPVALSGVVAINLLKNGSQVGTIEEVRPTGQVIVNGSFTLFLNGTTDFVQLQVANASGGNITISSTLQLTYQGA